LSGSICNPCKRAAYTFAEYDQYLDRTQEVRWLADPRVADIVRENLYHRHGDKYHLLCWCIMPNHVHVLFMPRIGQPATDHEPPIGESADARSPLSKIMHSLKSFTAHEANRILGRTGSFWQRESYDHWVRDDDELERIVMYIRGNPLKAGLVARPELWKYSSCHDRFQHDGDDSGWLKT
jgi:putative DNA methylase